MRPDIANRRDFPWETAVNLSILPSDSEMGSHVDARLSILTYAPDKAFMAGVNTLALVYSDMLLNHVSNHHNPKKDANTLRLIAGLIDGMPDDKNTSTALWALRIYLFSHIMNTKRMEHRYTL